MATVSPWMSDLALDDLEDGEELSLGVLRMDKEQVMDQFDDIYEEGFEKCRATFDCKVMYESFSVVGRAEDQVELENGSVLKSPLLAEVLEAATEVVLYAATVHGYEELAEQARGDAIEGMFCNAWGAGYSMSCLGLVKRQIVQAAREQGLYAGRGWSPGEHGLEMALQKAIVEAIDVSKIGIVSQGATTRPIMTTCGIMGLSGDPAIEQAGSDIPASTMG